MEAAFWHSKWSRGEIGFHEGEANTLLVAHFGQLGLGPGSRVFVPLCGKTRDIAWLLSRGCEVVGIELSELAVGQLFEELGLTPSVSQVEALSHWRAPGLDIYVGDFFALSAAQLGPVQAVYDRAALVALPEAMRQRYAAHLVAITGGAPQLLITYEYDQSQVNGPPFSVPAAEVHAHYATAYRVASLHREPVPGGLRGKTPSINAVWQLHQNPAAED